MIPEFIILSFRPINGKAKDIGISNKCLIDNCSDIAAIFNCFYYLIYILIRIPNFINRNANFIKWNAIYFTPFSQGFTLSEALT